MTVLDAGMDFVLPAELNAAEPAEERGGARDAVRLLVSRTAAGTVDHRRFTELTEVLLPGDLLVVNNSETLPASVTTIDGRVVHFSTPRPDGTWLIELRTADGPGSAPDQCDPGTRTLPLPGGATLTLLGRFGAPPGRRARAASMRLWRAHLDVAVLPYLLAHGRPIRYGYVPRPWPIEAYQTVFGHRRGSAEMPSAGRPFTAELVTALVSRGIAVAPITLHTGVASPEAHEPPYAEPFDVPPPTARLIEMTRAAGGRVIAVGTTVVRAVEAAADVTGGVRAAGGWTETIVTPERGLYAVDGLVTGFHEPRSSHLAMLGAFLGADLLRRCYAAALDDGYRWHEFGDLHLILP